MTLRFGKDPMGQVAREKGFDGKFLTALCDPQTGVMYGCRKLRDCMTLEHNDVRNSLLKYNGGSDQTYPDAVLALMDKYKSDGTSLVHL
jgi:soluble lytic murein transglycosylase-like protein